MSEKLDSLLTPQQKIDVAIADYIAARNAHPYHASKTAQTMAEIDADVIESARNRAITLLMRARSTLEGAAHQGFDEASGLIGTIIFQLENTEKLT